MTDELSEKSKCPKCHTKTLERDPEGDIHCWGCGSTFPGEMKSSMHEDQLLARQRFYEDNKTAILSDVQSIGAKATAKKWNVNGASLYHVLQRWEREEKEKPAAQTSDAGLKGRKREMKTGVPTNIKAKSDFYEKNKDSIIADLLHLGKPATRRKWRIPKGSLPRLMKKWLTPEQEAAVNNVGLKAQPETGHSDGGMPELPAFSDTWDPTVQVKWLEIYGKLLERRETDANS
jgi:hypothetical protein